MQKVMFNLDVISDICSLVILQHEQFSDEMIQDLKVAIHCDKITRYID